MVLFFYMLTSIVGSSLDVFQTNSGEKEGLSIELQIGSETAIVNGEEKSLAVAPKIENGETFIPLRFVSENAQKEVSWDGIIKEVYIADADLQIINLFDKHYQYMYLENLGGVMSTLDPESPAYTQTETLLSQVYPTYDLDYEYSVEIIDLQEQSAVVQTITKTTKISGPEFAENEIIATNEVTKINGQWKILSTDVVFIDYLKEDLLVLGEISIAQSEQDAILAVIEQSRKNFEAEDIDAETLLYHSDYPNLEQLMDQSKQLMAVYDLSAEVSDIEIFEATVDTAVVFYVTTVKKSSGPEFKDFASGNIVTLNKVDGKWLFANSDPVYVNFALDAEAEVVVE